MPRGFLDDDAAHAGGGDRGDADGEDRRAVTLTGRVLATARGQMLFDDGARQVWVNFRHISRQDFASGAHVGTITVPEWWAKQEGLI